MGMTAKGHEVLEHAKRQLIEAKTIGELRQAQAVILPLLYDLTLAQTAEAIGMSVGWTCKLRTRFIRGEKVDPNAKAGHRPRQNMSVAEESAFLAPFFAEAKTGGVLVVSGIKRALDKRLGRCVALSSVYNLLHRHDWRKLAPDKRHPKANVEAQDDWKKNFPGESKKSTGNGKRQGRSG